MSSPLNSPCGQNRPLTNRGSAIISVLVLAAVTAVIAAGFLFRSSQEAKMATRSFYDAVALNLAEGAIEQALFALNTGIASPTNGWLVPSDSSVALVKSITTGLTFQQATGAMYLRLDRINTASPTITAAAVVTILNQAPIVKQIRITGTKRQVWSGGVVAKSGVTMTGNNVIDGYDSTKGAYNLSTNRTDKGSICAASVACIGTGSVYGYATHRSDSAWPSTCSVRGATTPTGTTVDSTRVRTDYSVNLSNSTAPSSSMAELNHITSSLTLPRAGDLPDAKTGRYRYHCTGVDLPDGTSLSVNGAVDLVSDNDVNLSGSAQFSVGSASSSSSNKNWGDSDGNDGNGNNYGWSNSTTRAPSTRNYAINTNASFCLYTNRNITIQGTGGIKNFTGKPSNATIWGTCSSSQTQSFKLSCGGASHQCAIYAPNASIEFNDDEIHGSVVCNTLKLTGLAKCHYDTQLANIASDPNGDKNSLAVSTLVLGAWAELKDSPGTGSGATGLATVSGGGVTAAAILTAGSNYASGVPVKFSGGGGTGATGTAVISGGAVTGIVVTNAGSGYTSAPTVTVGSSFARDNRAPFNTLF